MMDFFDKEIKKALGSKEDVETKENDENSVNDEVIDEPTFTQSIEKDNFNDNEEIQSDDSEESPANVEIIDNPTPNEKIRNFRYLDNLIHTGVKEIVLDSDIILDGEEEFEYPGGINLDVDGLVIDGNGHSIDAKGRTIIFYCTGKKITIKNIILKNGFGHCAGAIFNNGELTIIKSFFFFYGSYEKGGSIYNGCVLTIIESVLTGNTVHSLGGAIYNNRNGKIAITKSTLDQNTSEYHGGAIHNDGQITINESILNKNMAEYHGGAIRNEGELFIQKSTLSGNVANSAGAIDNLVMLILSESIINQNSSEDNIIKNMGDFKVVSCEFSDNVSDNEVSGIIDNQDALRIYDSNFSRNIGSYIIVNVSDLSNLSIFNGKFKDNQISKSVIFNQGKSCTIERTIFEKHLSNIIINKSDLTLKSPKIKDDGKKILNEKYIFIRKSSDGLEDKIYGDGVVENKIFIPHDEKFDFGYLDKKIHESKTKEIMLEDDISFENYEIDYYEGGIELDIDNLIIDGNGHTIDAQDKTRIFYCTGKNITLKNLTLKNGHSHKNDDNLLNDDGGAIKINSNTDLTIKNCIFINNTSEGSGGAIHNSGRLIIANSTLSGNKAEGFGGAINNNKGELSIVESQVTNNFANGPGQVIFSYYGKVTVDGRKLMRDSRYVTRSTYPLPNFENEEIFDEDERVWLRYGN